MSARVDSTSTAPSGFRELGRTGLRVEAVSLGGEGILRTHGCAREAVPMILEALSLGVRYCDTAPAYASSQDYYGAAFREAGAGAREKVILASKSHDRTRDGSLRLLEDSLRRLGTTYLDVWQLHDLRTMDELDEIFGSSGRPGAMAAFLKAREEGRVRHFGITGHHDPAVLVEAMRRYDFDTVLCAMNPADGRRLPFVSTVVAEARRRGMGIVGMKALAHGDLVESKAATPEECIRYAASLADTVVIGCKSAAEVRQNLAAARELAAYDESERAALEKRLLPTAHLFDTFKRP